MNKKIYLLVFILGGLINYNHLFAQTNLSLIATEKSGQNYYLNNIIKINKTDLSDNNKSDKNKTDNKDNNKDDSKEDNKDDSDTLDFGNGTKIPLKPNEKLIDDLDKSKTEKIDNSQNQAKNKIADTNKNNNKNKPEIPKVLLAYQIKISQIKKTSSIDSQSQEQSQSGKKNQTNFSKEDREKVENLFQNKFNLYTEGNYYSFLKTNEKKEITGSVLASGLIDNNKNQQIVAEEKKVNINRDFLIKTSFINETKNYLTEIKIDTTSSDIEVSAKGNKIDGLTLNNHHLTNQAEFDKVEQKSNKNLLVYVNKPINVNENLEFKISHQLNHDIDFRLGDYLFKIIVKK